MARMHAGFGKRKLLAVLWAIALALCLTGAAQAQSTHDAGASTQEARSSRLQDRVFQSVSLGRPMHYRVLLPADYSQSVKSYPVLFLLHGWHGDYTNWTTLTNLNAYADALKIIVVMPDGEDSWYVDSATRAQAKFESYILHDLADEVDAHWRTIRAPHRRAIAGLSMGGYGALKFALKHPEAFAFAGSISGAFNAPSAELANSRADLKPSLEQAFGATASATRAANDVYALAAQAPAASTPYLYLDCGSGDTTFLAPNRRMAATLSERGITYEYHEGPGVHNWQFWDERLPDLLRAVVRHIAADSAN